MRYLVPPLLLVSSLGFAPDLAAQTFLWSPAGTAKALGNSNNRIPFWSQSATYQQIHDKEDMNLVNGGKPISMKGLAMRPAQRTAITGRTWDMRISLSHTKVTSQGASSTFSTNLGTASKIVFGTSTGYTKFSWKNFTHTGGPGAPSAPAYTIPFTSTFTYVPVVGNLCWEWRHKNATTIARMSMDATSAIAQRGAIGRSFGTGCTVKGNTRPATARIITSRVAFPDYNFQADLTNAPPNASAMLVLGLKQQRTQIPGWCTSIEIAPLIFLPGKTDGTGAWKVLAPLTALKGTRPFMVFLQYAFTDKTQTAGLGLSSTASYTTPNISGAHAFTRIYNAPFQSTTNGAELATSGTVGRNFGLVVGWLQ